MSLSALREPCKKIVTTDARGRENGYVVELFKAGRKTTLYLTVAFPGARKGYHLHTVRNSHLVCLRGKMRIAVVAGDTKEEYLLDAEKPERLFVPTNVWILYENVGEEEGWMVNFPSPPYDPELTDEQRELTPEAVEGFLASGTPVPGPAAR